MGIRALAPSTKGRCPLDAIEPGAYLPLTTQPLSERKPCRGLIATTAYAAPERTHQDLVLDGSQEISLSPRLCHRGAAESLGASRGIKHR